MYGKNVGQKPSVSCHRCILVSVTPLRLSVRGVYRVCVCVRVLMWDNRAVTFSHTSNGSHLVDIHAPQPWELAASLHWGQKHAFLFVCSHRIGGALIKAFATTRSDPSGFYTSSQKKKPQSWRSLTALSSNVKQRSTSNGWQNLDEKRIFYSWLSTKGRSETLGMGGTCRNLDPEPWTWCLFHLGPMLGFNEETWSEEQMTSEVCQDTRGGDTYNRQRFHFSLSPLASTRWIYLFSCCCRVRIHTAFDAN